MVKYTLIFDKNIFNNDSLISKTTIASHQFLPAVRRALYTRSKVKILNQIIFKLVLFNVKLPQKYFHISTNSILSPPWLIGLNKLNFNTFNTVNQPDVTGIGIQKVFPFNWLTMELWSIYVNHARFMLSFAFPRICVWRPEVCNQQCNQTKYLIHTKNSKIIRTKWKIYNVAGKWEVH